MILPWSKMLSELHWPYGALHTQFSVNIALIHIPSYELQSIHSCSNQAAAAPSWKVFWTLPDEIFQVSFQGAVIVIVVLRLSYIFNLEYISKRAFCWCWSWCQCLQWCCLKTNERQKLLQYMVIHWFQLQYKLICIGSKIIQNPKWMWCMIN